MLFHAILLLIMNAVVVAVGPDEGGWGPAVESERKVLYCVCLRVCACSLAS